MIRILIAVVALALVAADAPACGRRARSAAPTYAPTQPVYAAPCGPNGCRLGSVMGSALAAPFASSAPAWAVQPYQFAPQFAAPSCSGGNCSLPSGGRRR